MSAQKRSLESEIKSLEQRAGFSYTYSQLQRDQQEKSTLEIQVEDQARDNQALSDEIKRYCILSIYLISKILRYKKMSENLNSKFKNIHSELNRYREILNIIFSLVNSDPNYYGQTTPFFEYRHLANPEICEYCEFEISPNDRVYKDFLNLVGPEAKIRIEEIAEKGEFKTWSGKYSTVNTVIFGQTLDMDVKKSQSGLSFCFTKHNPARMHKDHRGKFNHFSK